MKKRIVFALLIALPCLLCALMLSACREKYTEGLEYQLNADGESYSVVGPGKVTDNNIVIPDFYQGKPVTTIGERAFENYAELQRISIPDSVTSIGNFAFAEKAKEYQTIVAKLTKVHFGKNSQLKIIGDEAFRNCIALSSFDIPDGVTSIGSGAFSGCTSLTMLEIPETVTTIFNFAFLNCDEIIQEDNGVFYVDHWVVDCTESVTNPVLRPDTVGIAGGSFRECDELISIKIPASVIGIGDSSFYGCNKLVSVIFEDDSQMKYIGDYAFLDSGLTAITIPDGVVRVGDGAFRGCSGLIAVDFRETSQLKTIGIGAFEGCCELNSFTIPANVTSIGYNAFSGCFAMTTISCDTVEWWVCDAFDDTACGEIVDLNFRNLVLEYTSYYWKRS